MKKTLLLAAVAALSTASVSADIITLNAADAKDIVAKEDNGNLVDMTSCTIGDYSFTFVAGAEASASQTPRWWANDETIRIYKGSQMTVNAPVDMNGIVFSAKATTGCKNFTTASADQGTVVVDSPTVTWTAATPAKTMTLILPSDVNANFQIQTITVYTGADKPGSTTVTTPHCTTVKELLEVADGSEFTFEGNVVVAYANGPDCYIYDNTGATLLYSSKTDPWAATLEQGTIITEFAGKRSDYRGTAQFNPTMNSLVTEGETQVVAHQCNTLAEVTALPVDSYVWIPNVASSLNSENDRYALIEFANGETLNVYNRFCTASYDPQVAYPAAGQYDVYGLRSVYNDEVQINFTGTTPASVGVNSINAEDGVVVVYDLQGRRVEGQAAAGLYIVVKNGKAQKVLVK